MAQIIGNAFRVTGVVCESCFNTSWLQAVELTATMSMVALCLADSPMTAASVQTNIFQWIFVESIVLFVSNFLTRSLSNPDGTLFFFFLRVIEFYMVIVILQDSCLQQHADIAVYWHTTVIPGSRPLQNVPPCQWDHVTGQWDHVTSLLVNKNDDAHFIDTSTCWMKKRKEREREKSWLWH